MKKISVLQIIKGTKTKPAVRPLEIYHIDKGYSEPLYFCSDRVVSRTSGLFGNCERHVVENAYGVKFNVAKKVL